MFAKLFLFLFIIFTPYVNANNTYSNKVSDSNNNNFNELTTDKKSPFRELNWLNKKFLIKQRKSIDELTRNNFGRSINTTLRDINLLQRLVDEEKIKPKNTELLQALGVVLGDLITRHNNKLHWAVYKDDLGESHAVCLKKSSYCMFPITMISRRVEVGLKPNIRKIYDDALEDVKPYLPTNPYLSIE